MPPESTTDQAQAAQIRDAVQAWLMRQAHRIFTERLQQVLRMDNAELTDIEKTVLARRFPLEDGRQRQTLEDIGRQMRVSKERVRQIQNKALGKLRAALEQAVLG